MLRHTAELSEREREGENGINAAGLFRDARRKNPLRRGFRSHRNWSKTDSIGSLYYSIVSGIFNKLVA